jgi:hypothetical protein
MIFFHSVSFSRQNEPSHARAPVNLPSFKFLSLTSHIHTHTHTHTHTQFTPVIPKVCSADHKRDKFKWFAILYTKQHFVLRGALKKFSCSAHHKSLETTALRTYTHILRTYTPLLYYLTLDNKGGGTFFPFFAFGKKSPFPFCITKICAVPVSDLNFVCLFVLLLLNKKFLACPKSDLIYIQNIL